MADKRKIKTEASSSSSNINNGRGESVVVDVGRRRSSCGYCKSGSNTSITHGLWAHSLTVHDYQALLDRGWRRSGCFLYKPEMEKTCCPSYTIRLKASDFVPSKEQVRVSKRMQRFLEGSLIVKKPDEQNEPSRDVIRLSDNDHGKADNSIENYLSNQIDSIVVACTQRGEFPNDINVPKASVKPVAPSKRKLQAEEAHDLLYSSNISFQISAALKRGNKTVQKDDQSIDPNPKLIAEMLSGHLSNLTPDLHLSVKACNGHINFYSTEVQQPHSESIAGKPSSVCKDSSSSTSGTKGISVNKQSLEIRLKRSGFDPEEYALYRRYQIKVHNDTPDRVTESSYKRFLVDSPLIFVPTSGSGDASVPPCGFGSFHQQYLINGKLIAVGVIDILPKCLSSKYLFWDPDLAQLSLGKYSALQEINWVRENEKHCSSLQYYYLGYYIHSCSKMRYKAAYRPSELLCPLRYQWVSFDIAKRLLDRKAYVVLSDYANLLDEGDMSPNNNKNVVEDQREEEDERFGEGSNDVRMDGDEEMSEVAFDESDDDDDGTGSLTPVEMQKDVSNIVIGLKGMHLKYKDIRQAFGTNERNYLENQLRKYATVVGTDLSERMIYSLG